MSSNKIKKQINPVTNKLYKLGDWNQDKTKRFLAYRTGPSSIQKDGFNKIKWLTDEQFKETRKKQIEWQRSKREELKNLKKNVKKPINKYTGKPYKKGDWNEDKTKRMIKYNDNYNAIDENGFLKIDWLTTEKYEERDLKIKEYSKKKREKYRKENPKINAIRPINPETGKRWVSGEWNSERTKRFYKYRSDYNSVDKNGIRRILWLTPEKYEEFKNKTRIRSGRKRSEILNEYKSGKISKRINPKTGKEFIKGEENKDGKLFWAYNLDAYLNENKQYVYEVWVTEEQARKRYIRNTYNSAKNRSKKNDILFDLDIDYLISIFPKDRICPVTNEKMLFGGDKMYSPSIDKIEPEKGYTKGNIVWMINYANTIKGMNGVDVIFKLADFFRKKQLKQI